MNKSIKKFGNKKKDAILTSGCSGFVSTQTAEPSVMRAIKTRK